MSLSTLFQSCPTEINGKGQLCLFPFPSRKKRCSGSLKEKIILGSYLHPSHYQVARILTSSLACNFLAAISHSVIMSCQVTEVTKGRNKTEGGEQRVHERADPHNRLSIIILDI